MKKESKPILGQWLGNRLYFADHEKQLIIDDYLSGNESKKEVYQRYTGYSAEHGKISKWMRQFGLEAKFKKSTNFDNMPKRVKDIECSDEFETLQLKKRIAELEKQLQTAEMKAIAFSTMVDIAEKEYNIPIRKKLNTKPSK